MLAFIPKGTSSENLYDDFSIKQQQQNAWLLHNLKKFKFSKTLQEAKKIILRSELFHFSYKLSKQWLVLEQSASQHTTTRISNKGKVYTPFLCSNNYSHRNQNLPLNKTEYQNRLLKGSWQDGNTNKKDEMYITDVGIVTDTESYKMKQHRTTWVLWREP